MTMLESLFDRVIVLGLPSSTDRRAHIRRHFAEIGLERYAFHDACGPDHPDVAALYAADLVAGYPPCFRCGKLDCGEPDCNNVLIPQQVAVFATYLSVWRDIAAGNDRVLVCEDDVVFHPWTETVLARLDQAIAAGEVVFRGDHPTLLRLGWALSDDHDGTQPFRLVRDMRMANPCHALTGAYARALLAAFDGVRHTSDVYQHRLAPVARDHAVTVLPPIASELSWSTGQFQSLIHPSEIHAAHLEKTGRPAEAEAYRREVSRHAAAVAHKARDPQDAG